MRVDIKKLIPIFIMIAIIIALLFVIVFKNNDSSTQPTQSPSGSITNSPSLSSTHTNTQAPSQSHAPTISSQDPTYTPSPTITPSPSPTATPTPIPEFNPYPTNGTDPSVMMKSTTINVGGKEVNSYNRIDRIDFLTGDLYSSVEGIITFRGNNFRDTAAYGSINFKEYAFEKIWTHTTGEQTGTGTSSGSHYWSGSGWTGQPLIIKWPDSTRRIMTSMYDWARETDGLVEVIYATMDGNIYFYELYSGEPTRNPYYVGHVFKGAGALDPRGYPLMYCGSGDDCDTGKSRAFIINLIDCSILYEYGIKKDDFAYRSWTAYDSSPLVDAETDTLIQPGENGVVYIIKLNTVYNETEGSISINPEMTKWKYRGKRSSSSKYWYGIEASATAWRGYLFLADNGGHLMCLDINTLKLIWVQDTVDDTNCTPVLELEDGHPYLYISTSFHAGWRAEETAVANIPVMKIDGVTGEVVWRIDYPCYTKKNVSGGVQGTIAIGKNNVSDLIFVPVARYPSVKEGRIVAISKTTGEQVWSYDNTPKYSWTTPTVVYDNNGDGYIIWASTSGYIYIINARTGELITEMSLKGGIIEASPAIFNDMMVLGTRGKLICGVKLK